MLLLELEPFVVELVVLVVLVVFVVFVVFVITVVFTVIDQTSDVVFLSHQTHSQETTRLMKYKVRLKSN